MIRFKACFRMTLFVIVKCEDQSRDPSHDSFHHVILKNLEIKIFLENFEFFYYNFMVLKNKIRSKFES